MTTDHADIASIAITALSEAQTAMDEPGQYSAEIGAAHAAIAQAAAIALLAARATPGREMPVEFTLRGDAGPRRISVLPSSIVSVRDGSDARSIGFIDDSVARVAESYEDVMRAWRGVTQ